MISDEDLLLQILRLHAVAEARRLCVLGKSPAGEPFAILRRRDVAVNDDEQAVFVPLNVAAHLVGVTLGVLKSAVRRRELEAYGTQRTRVVRRDAVLLWAESRAPLASRRDGAAIAAKVARLVRARSKKGGAS